MRMVISKDTYDEAICGWMKVQHYIDLLQRHIEVTKEADELWAKVKALHKGMSPREQKMLQNAMEAIRDMG